MFYFSNFGKINKEVNKKVILRVFFGFPILTYSVLNVAIHQIVHINQTMTTSSFRAILLQSPTFNLIDVLTKT